MSEDPLDAYAGRKLSTLPGMTDRFAGILKARIMRGLRKTDCWEVIKIACSAWRLGRMSR